METMKIVPLLMLFVCSAISLEFEDDDYDFESFKLSESEKFAQLSSIETEFPAGNTCVAVPKGGLQWLVHVRESDYGWKQETPRAIIALAINGWPIVTEEIHQMELQLDVELTNILLRNHSLLLLPTELAMYIQALVALNRNPRDFHGLDLVALLLYRVERMPDLHPFVVLALCNARAVVLAHLKDIRRYTTHHEHETRQNTELKSLALKAYACAASLDSSLAKFNQEMNEAANCISIRQKDDGSFGNIYTTALAVQALISSNSNVDWKKAAALDYLRKHAPLEKSVMGVYAIELALKSQIYPFIKDLYPNRTENLEVAEPTDLGSSIYYTVRNDRRPDVEFMIFLRIPKLSDFFEVMQMSAEKDSNFKFSYYLDSDKMPMVYAIDGLPNDAEENFYWRLCKQQRLQKDRNLFFMETVHTSPASEKTDSSSHYIMWYTDQQCESRNQRTSFQAE